MIRRERSRSSEQAFRRYKRDRALPGIVSPVAKLYNEVEKEERAAFEELRRVTPAGDGGVFDPEHYGHIPAGAWPTQADIDNLMLRSATFRRAFEARVKKRVAEVKEECDDDDGY